MVLGQDGAGVDLGGVSDSYATATVSGSLPCPGAIAWDILMASETRELRGSQDTHSGADGAEGHQALDVVGVAAAPGVPAWVLSPLQDELLSAEAGVLITDPAAKTDQGLPGLPVAALGLLLGAGTGAQM